MALGIDDGHWVLICQRPEDKHFQVFRYDHHANKIFVDQKAGGPKDLEEFKKFLEYFLSEAKVSDLVTLLPPEV
ncbi:MAG: hypothetical protein HQ596_07415 [Candidatus Saganbacteria bacterium]|nr:hypothetical protein [Candidatus Saganbacteria bacterium]